MAPEIQRYHARMANLLLLHVVASLAFPLLLAPFGSIADYVLGFVVGLGVILLIDRRYFLFLYWTLVYLLYLIYEIIVSSLNVAWLVIQPRPKFDPGIVAVPLTVTTGLEITLLASAITLTPGTMSLDLGHTADGKFILFVHALRVGNPEAFRGTIKQGYERLILRISRGVARV